MKTLAPYLLFQGTCEAALAHYADALGGTVTELKRFGDGPMEVTEAQKRHVMHARLEADALRILASDGLEKPAGEGAIQLSLEFTDTAELARVFDKLAAGGTVTMPLADQFWGARFGMLVDRFGVAWMLNCPTKA
jgi:PhnB protein